VVLRRIEDRRRRGICFRKRRAGLVKKAEELAVLCDADVALLVVSPFDGTVHRFAAPATYVLLIPLFFSGDLFLSIRIRTAPMFRTVLSAGGTLCRQLSFSSYKADETTNALGAALLFSSVSDSGRRRSGCRWAATVVRLGAGVTALR
jgi:hypothetical protein